MNAMSSTTTELTVRYEDAQLAVISKPAGLVVHPGAGPKGPTLIDALATRWPELAALDGNRAGLLHRLDKDTSGLLIIAKTEAAKANLSAQFAGRTVRKRYQAVVHGVPAHTTGAIDAPITRHHADRKRMAVRPDGKAAQTSYAVLSSADGFSWLDVWIATGRTHQIRVHLAALGHPVVGDQKYGRQTPADQELGRQWLHAVELGFTHPRTGEPLSVTDELPPELQRFLKSGGSMKAETIVITGFPGTGSSTVARMLAEEFGFEYVYAGGIMRAMAAERGQSIDDFHTEVLQNPEIDRQLDATLATRAGAGQAVIESRTLPWLLGPDVAAYKVWLRCTRAEQVRRMSLRGPAGVAESRRLAEREAVERDRYKVLYGFDMQDLAVFDQVIDTTTIPARQVADLIIAELTG